jgi:hypothetical protein
MAGRACIWDYIAVMYRERGDPVDPRAWMLRNRWLYPLTELIRDVRSGRWRKVSRLGKAALCLGAAAHAAVVTLILGLIALILTGFAPLRHLDMPGRGTALLLAAGFVIIAAGWPTAWTGWIAAGGPDRATAILRRARARVLREPAEDVAVVLAARRRHWNEEISRWPHRRFNSQRHWIDPAFALAGIATGMVLFAGMIALGSLRIVFTLVLAMYVPIMIHLWWGRRRRKALQRRLFDALAAAACPDCAYSMREIAGRPVEADIAFWPGPRRCPECGSPWPLVPPPTPNEKTADHAGRESLARAAGAALRGVLHSGVATGAGRSGAPGV